MKVFEVLFENDNQRIDNILSSVQSSLNRIGTELDKFSEEKQQSMASMALKTIESSLGVVTDNSRFLRDEIQDTVNDVSNEVSKLRWQVSRGKPIDYIMGRAKALANIIRNVLDFTKTGKQSA